MRYGTAINTTAIASSVQPVTIMKRQNAEICASPVWMSKFIKISIKRESNKTPPNRPQSAPHNN